LVVLVMPLPLPLSMHYVSEQKAPARQVCSSGRGCARRLPPRVADTELEIKRAVNLLL
jgi:hypothetical protein